MAKVEVVMPQMGESITTGTITKWHKNAGDIMQSFLKSQLIKLNQKYLLRSTEKSLSFCIQKVQL